MDAETTLFPELQVYYTCHDNNSYLPMSSRMDGDGVVPALNMHDVRTTLWYLAREWVENPPVTMSGEPMIFTAWLQMGTGEDANVLALAHCRYRGEDSDPAFEDGMWWTRTDVDCDLKLWVYVSDANGEEVMVRPQPNLGDHAQWLPYAGRTAVCEVLSGLDVAGQMPDGARLRGELQVVATDYSWDLGRMDVALLEYDGAGDRLLDILPDPGRFWVQVNDGHSDTEHLVTDLPADRHMDILKDLFPDSDDQVGLWLDLEQPDYVLKRVHVRNHPQEPECPFGWHDWQMPDGEAIGHQLETGLTNMSLPDDGYSALPDQEQRRIEIRECCAHCGQFRETSLLTLVSDQGGVVLGRDPTQTYGEATAASLAWIDDQDGEPGESEMWPPPSWGAL